MATSQTISDYLATSNRLRAVCARAVGTDATALGWGQFVQWLIDQKPRWSSSTWWSRKAAVLCALRCAQDERPDDPEIPIARTALKHVTSEGADKSTKRTSAKKAKKFPLEDRQRIFAALKLGHSAKARDLIDMIRAGCAAGLRPVEWRDAQVVEPDCGYCFKLVVVNAKSENGAWARTDADFALEEPVDRNQGSDRTNNRQSCEFRFGRGL